MENNDDNPNKFDYFLNLYDKLKQKFDDFEKILNKKNEESTKEIKNMNNYKKFINWLKENDAIFEKNLDYPVSFGPFNIIGVSSKTDINKNQSFIYIPKKLIINSSEVKLNDNLFPIFNNDKFEEIRDSCLIVLTMFLICEYLKGDCSFFKPYIDLVNVENPLFWQKDELNALDDEGIVYSIEEEKKEIRLYFDKIINLMKNNQILSQNNSIMMFSKKFLEEISFEKFLTFYCFVESRNFMVNEEISLLIPLADSINHSTVDVYYEFFDSYNFVSKHTVKFDENMNSKLEQTNHDIFLLNLTEKNIIIDDNFSHIKDLCNNEEENIFIINDEDFFTINTGKRQYFYKNSQIFNFYGSYSNEALLISYGFVKLLNKHDKIKFTIKYENEENFNFTRLLLYNFEKLFCFDGNFLQIILKLKAKKINTKFIKLLRLLIIFEDTEEEEDVSYFDNMKENFDIEREIRVINRAIEILGSTLRLKSINFEVSEELIDMNNILLREINKKKPNEKETYEELLKNYRKFTIIAFRISQKYILILHIRYLLLILEILNESLKKEIKICDAYHQKYLKFEKNDEEFFRNRKIIMKYFSKNKIIK